MSAEAPERDRYQIMPALSAAQHAELLDDIQARGVLVAVEYDEDGAILDGHHRVQICSELGITDWPRVVRHGLSEADKFIHALLMNVHRRQLTDAQKAVLALDILPHLEEQARERQGERTDIVERIPRGNEGKARDQAAAAVAVNARYISDTKRIAREAPQLLEKMRAGDLSVPAAMRQLKDDEHKANLHRPVTVNLYRGIHRGDFRELSSQIADDSVELVFTDPPYDSDEAIALYEDAARVAARILKPGGSFIAYSGQYRVLQVLQACSQHLRYYWTLASVNSGGTMLLGRLGIRNGWKPLAWFVKGTRGDVQNIVFDTVTGGR